MLIAEEPPALPPAPVPSDMRPRRFSSQIGGEDRWLDHDPMHDPNLTCKAFYAGIKSWGKYESVTSPTGAVVVFEIRLVLLQRSPQSRLLILDPKRHTTLWTLDQVANGANRDAPTRKNFDTAMNFLVTTIKDLVPKAIQTDWPATALRSKRLPLEFNHFTRDNASSSGQCALIRRALWQFCRIRLSPPKSK